MKKILLFAPMFLAAQAASGLDIDKYTEVSCRLHHYGKTITAQLEFDGDADLGQERWAKLGDSDEISIDGDKVSIHAEVSQQPIFFVQINAGSETVEVEVLADDIDSVNVMGGSKKASGHCIFR